MSGGHCRPSRPQVSRPLRPTSTGTAAYQWPPSLGFALKMFGTTPPLRQHPLATSPPTSPHRSEPDERRPVARWAKRRAPDVTTRYTSQATSPPPVPTRARVLRAPSRRPADKTPGTGRDHSVHPTGNITASRPHSGASLTSAVRGRLVGRWAKRMRRRRVSRRRADETQGAANTPRRRRGQSNTGHTALRPVSRQRPRPQARHTPSSAPTPSLVTPRNQQPTELYPATPEQLSFNYPRTAPDQNPPIPLPPRTFRRAQPEQPSPWHCAEAHRSPTSTPGELCSKRSVRERTQPVPLR